MQNLKDNHAEFLLTFLSGFNKLNFINMVPLFQAHW